MSTFVYFSPKAIWGQATQTAAQDIRLEVQTPLCLEQNVLRQGFCVSKASIYHRQRRQGPPSKGASLTAGIEGGKWKGGLEESSARISDLEPCWVS